VSRVPCLPPDGREDRIPKAWEVLDVVQNARGAQNTAAAATGVGARLGEV